MRLAVVGSRDFNNYDLLKEILDYVHNLKEVTMFVSGGAKGADKLGERWADENNIPKEIYPAEWNNLDDEPCIIKYNSYGKPYNCLAGHNRNELIVKNSDKIIAFYNGISKGTANTIKLCEEHKKTCKIIYYNDEAFIKKLKIKNL